MKPNQAFHEYAENSGKIGSHKKPTGRLASYLIPIVIFAELSSRKIPAIVPFFSAFISLINVFVLFLIICSDRTG